MVNENEKYEKLMKILREAKPELQNTDDIKNKVINRISAKRNKEDVTLNIFDYLFGWVYIGWVRKSLIAASVFIVAFFVYQQSVILKRINALSNQPVINESRFFKGLPDNLEGKLLFYRLSGRRIRAERNAVTEKQIEEFLESVNDLQVKYKDLLKLIEEDPELKMEIEKRMTGKHKKKFNL